MPRKCPQCGDSFYHSADWEWHPEHEHNQEFKYDKIHTCKCGLRIHSIHKPEEYIMYNKPASIIKLQKWIVI